CVQCRDDAACAGTQQVCDTTAKRCVDCTATKTAGCSINGAGRICLQNDTCGCATDSDCGGPFSGRICDRVLQKCSPGCRKTGGNFCPPTYVCRFSADPDLGFCEPLPPPDAAVPDMAPDLAPDVEPDMPPPDMSEPDAGVD